MGANPAIVPSGPEKGLQVLKDESELGFQLLHSLSDAQLQKTLIRAEAPSDIITGNKRTVMLEHREGIRFYELDRKQQDQFMQLLNVYRSEEHTSELQSLMRISYHVFCFKKKK